MRILSFKATRRSKKRNQIFKLSIFKELKIGVEYGKDVYSDTLYGLARSYICIFCNIMGFGR